jgi:hypothetical protein
MVPLFLAPTAILGASQSYDLTLISPPKKDSHLIEILPIQHQFYESKSSEIYPVTLNILPLELLQRSTKILPDYQTFDDFPQI